MRGDLRVVSNDDDDDEPTLASECSSWLSMTSVEYLYGNGAGATRGNKLARRVRGGGRLIRGVTHADSQCHKQAVTYGKTTIIQVENEIP